MADVKSFAEIVTTVQHKKCVFNGKDYIFKNINKPYSYNIIDKKCVIDVCLGILHLSNRQIVKTNKSGIIMKLFSPFDTRIQPFLVKTKKFELNDYYAVVKMEFDEISNSIVGSVLNYIGKVAECDISPELICTCNWKKKVDKDITKYLYIDVGKRTVVDTTNCVNSMVISIDPFGCRDIDDAIQCIEYDEHVQLRVHIADVSSYIPEGSELDIELSNRIESLYFTDKTINMINDALSTDVCSLIEKNVKRTFTLIADIKKDTTIDNIKYKFVQTNTYIDKNTTYEEVDKCVVAPDLYDDIFSKNILLLYDTGRIIGRIIGNNTDRYDSHIMVSNYMILTNVLASNALKIIPNSLIRAHKKPEATIISEKKDDVLSNIRDTLLMERAMYFLDSERENIHYGLGVSRYTHFTSPIRRYADIVVHRMMVMINNGITDYDCAKLVTSVFKMNHFKKLYRDAMIMDKILNYFNDTCEIDGHIVYIGSNGIKVYIDDIQKIINIHIVHEKIEKLLNVIVLNESMYLYTDLGQLQLNMYQKVRVKIFKLKSSIELFRTILIDPDVMTIFK